MKHAHSRPKEGAPRCRRSVRLGALVLACAAAVPSMAQQEQIEVSISHDRIVNTLTYLSAHPDVRWRRTGLEAYNNGHFEWAAGYFKHAARYADKPSQAMYAEMLWQGKGVEQDRALAYVWMDLAAERGYLPFLAKREYYWAELGAQARARALEIGPAVYAEYGDAVAKPRMVRRLEQARRKTTGSRLGFASAGLEVLLPTADGRLDVMSGGETINGGEFYKDVYYDPETYFAWQDRMWHDPLDTRDENARQGTVEVKPLQRVDPEE